MLILMQEIFYLGTINDIYAAFRIHERLYPHRIITFRLVVSAAYCLIGSLCVTGMIWAFRAGWHVNGAQFSSRECTGQHDWSQKWGRHIDGRLQKLNVARRQNLREFDCKGNP